MKRGRVAIVYDRVNKWGGAERVLLTLHELFPKADLFTSVYDPVGAPWAKVFPHIYTSFLQKIPGASRNHEFLAALMPVAFESFDFSNYDLVISVTSESAKGIITKGKTFHVSYCLTPTRYLWNGYNTYFENPMIKRLGDPIVSYLRRWDVVASSRPDRTVAISTVVKDRIKKYYGQDVSVIFPPVNTSLFRSKKTSSSKKYFLVVSRLVKYKKVDLAIKAFNKLGYPLVVVGKGRSESSLRKMANKNIRFVGSVTDEELKSYYENAIALIFPQHEDFGITSVEAQSAGIPVVAYARGGSLDTVIEGKTGLFFEKQTVDSLVQAIKLVKKMKFEKDLIVESSNRFSKERFLKEFATMLTR